MSERLVDDAVPLGQPKQRVELLVGCVGLQLESQPDRLKADGRILVDGECAPHVELSLGMDATDRDRHLERGGDSSQRHTCASNECLQ